jgi:L-fuconolactonase
VRQFRRQRFVLDHLAKPPIKSGDLKPWTSGIQALAESPNVMCKLSGMVTEADWQHWQPEHLTPILDVAFKCFGPQRLMIGSDWPVCSVAAPYSRAMRVVKDYLAGFSAADREAVLGGNAQRFWKLSGG